MGHLLIDGIAVSCTLEAVTSKLPVGRYDIRLIKKSPRKQDIAILPKTSDLEPTPLTKITIGHSWKNAEKMVTKERFYFSPVLIGNVLTPGVMYKSGKDFERLTDRLTKCIVERNEPIELVVKESDAVESTPTALWC